ncbi:MAG: hypothetical protein L6W00_06595 [Lentisphaeria bacterium]|nr:MAG: hypothetical protein L6W00_06595 [Lentisphaeria bacterium]
MVSRERKLLGLFFVLGVVLTPAAGARDTAQLTDETREALNRVDQGKQENEQRAARLVSRRMTC